MSDPILNDPEIPSQPRFFHVAGQYRRIPIYIALAAPAVLWIFWAAGKPLPYLPPVFFLLIAAALALLIESWRLRLDKEGIARHRLFLGWDIFPWQDFIQGHITRGIGLYSFLLPESRLGRGKLLLDWLGKEDRESLLHLINRHLARPVIVTPDSVTLKKLGGTTWTLNGEGIQYRGRRQWETFSWDNVQSVELVRLSHEHDNFRELKMDLGARTLFLRIDARHGGNPSWRGPEAAQVAALVLRHAPRDRVQITSLTGPPRSLREAQSRLEIVRKRMREIRKIMWIFSSAGLVFLAWGIWEWIHTGSFQYLAQGIVLGVFIAMMVPMLGIPYRAGQRLARELERWQEGTPSAKEQAGGLSAEKTFSNIDVY